MSTRRADQVQGDRARPAQAAPGQLSPFQDAVQQWFSDNAPPSTRSGRSRARSPVTWSTRARELEDTEQRNAIIAAGLILRSCCSWSSVSPSLIARSMVRPLRRLRAEALDVAGPGCRRSCGSLRGLRGDPDASTSPPIAVDTNDEIGEVAQAFDEVHRAGRPAGRARSPSCAPTSTRCSSTSPAVRRPWSSGRSR